MKNGSLFWIYVIIIALGIAFFELSFKDPHWGVEPGSEFGIAAFVMILIFLFSITLGGNRFGR